MFHVCKKFLWITLGYVSKHCKYDLSRQKNPTGHNSPIILVWAIVCGISHGWKVEIKHDGYWVISSTLIHRVNIFSGRKRYRINRCVVSKQRTISGPGVAKRFRCHEQSDEKIWRYYIIEMDTLFPVFSVQWIDIIGRVSRRIFSNELSTMLRISSLPLWKRIEISHKPMEKFRYRFAASQRFHFSFFVGKNCSINHTCTCASNGTDGTERGGHKSLPSRTYHPSLATETGGYKSVLTWTL